MYNISQRLECDTLSKSLLEFVLCSVQPNYDYRRTVRRMLPKLKLLDDVPLQDADLQPMRCASVFDDDWKLIDDLVREGMVLTENKIDDMPGKGIILAYFMHSFWINDLLTAVYELEEL